MRINLQLISIYSYYYKILTFLILLLFFQSGAKPGEDYPALPGDGMWCWFQDPRAIIYNGETYCALLDNQASVKVWSYNHETKDTNLFVLRKNFWDSQYNADDHNCPSLLVRNDGRIMAFYTHHDGLPNIRYRITKRAGDITDWETEKSISTPQHNSTYTHSFQLSEENNRIYLFTRCINWHPTMVTSNDNGSTWTSPKEVIGGTSDRPYAKYCSDGKKRIHFAFTNGHARTYSENNINYFYYENDNFYKANGTLIKSINNLPIAHNGAEVVYDYKENGRAWIWDIAIEQETGYPVLVFVTFPNSDYEKHEYYYARFDGTSWKKKKLIRSGRWFPVKVGIEKQYSGGISLDHSDPSIIYMSIQDDYSSNSNDCFEIQKWTTPDHGDTWEKEIITEDSDTINVRPIAPWPHPITYKPKQKMLFWMNGYYDYWHTSSNYKINMKLRYHIDSTGSVTINNKDIAKQINTNTNIYISRISSGVIDITFPQLIPDIKSLNVSMYNTNGKKVWQNISFFNNVNTISLKPKLSKGLYCLHFIGKNLDGKSMFESYSKVLYFK